MADVDSDEVPKPDEEDAQRELDPDEDEGIEERQKKHYAEVEDLRSGMLNTKNTPEEQEEYRRMWWDELRILDRISQEFATMRQRFVPAAVAQIREKKKRFKSCVVM